MQFNRINKNKMQQENKTKVIRKKVKLYKILNLTIYHMRNILTINNLSPKIRKEKQNKNINNNITKKKKEKYQKIQKHIQRKSQNIKIKINKNKKQ